MLSCPGMARTRSPIPPAARAFFAKMGRKGGKKRAASMTPEARALAAQQAAQARWGVGRPKGLE